jgi:uncharacterized phage protein (predicted DNA packaging)
MAISNGYCTLDEVKSALRITDNTDDELLENAIEGASRRIDGYCGRRFYQQNATLSLYAIDSYTLPTQDDLYSVTTLKTDDDGDGTYETTWTTGVDYQLEPLDAVITGQPIRTITAIGGKTFPLFSLPALPSAQIVGVWGWSAIPDDVREACVLLTMRGFARYNAALGVVGFADMAIQVRAIDPDVRDFLNPYRKFGIA